MPITRAEFETEGLTGVIVILKRPNITVLTSNPCPDRKQVNSCPIKETESFGS